MTLAPDVNRFQHHYTQARHLYDNWSKAVEPAMTEAAEPSNLSFAFFVLQKNETERGLEKAIAHFVAANDALLKLPDVSCVSHELRGEFYQSWWQVAFALADISYNKVVICEAGIKALSQQKSQEAGPDVSRATIGEATKNFVAIYQKLNIEAYALHAAALGLAHVAVDAGFDLGGELETMTFLRYLNLPVVLKRITAFIGNGQSASP